jgi:acid phosphatase
MPAMTVSRLAALALAVVLAAGGCRSARPAPGAHLPDAAAPAASVPSYESLRALLWFQTAEECRWIQRSTFAAARRALDAALADAHWSALAQGAEASALPPAVIADIDETLLDNSAFEGGLLRTGGEFTADAWRAWVEAERATALPGALEFVRYAAQRGVTVFYISNRDAPFEAATRANLAREGFPLREDVDTVLLRGERSEWKTDKETRRREVAASHRVLLQLGDDLNDFVGGVDATPVSTRRAIADAHGDRFGASWFVLPNPLYGSWEKALGAGLPRPANAAEARTRQLESVRAFP